MARGNPALQKNLAELESEIGRLLEHPSSYIHDDIDGEVGFYKTFRKITFMKTLLTAEMDSHSGGRPEHLHHLALRLSILEKTFVNWVDSGDGIGAVSKGSDTSASCSCTESCVVDEEFVEEDNVDQEAKEFGASSSETETILSPVSQVTRRGRVESKEEGIEDEEENERNQEEDKEGEREVEVIRKDEKRRDGKHVEMVGESTVEVTEDEEDGRERIQGGKVSESKVEVNEDEKAEEKKQEAEMVDEIKVVVKDDAEERDRDRKVKTVEEDKVEAAEEKGRWKQEGEMVGSERKFEAEEDDKRRKEGAELTKDEKEIERSQERQMVGESMVEVIIDDKQEEGKDQGEMMGAAMRGRQRKREAEMSRMQKIEVKVNEKGKERKQRSYRIMKCMTIGCAAAAGIAIALIGIAVTNIFSMEETIYLVPT